MNRTRVFAAVLFLEALLPLAASAQNLEAGKSPGQLFSNNCAECHRTPRGLLRTVPPGSLPGFLREHYTTSKDMAQQLAGFLIGNGATDPRGRPPEARQPPQGAAPPQAAQQQRPPEPEQPRPQRPIDQQQSVRPPEPPAAQAARPDLDAKLSRRERRAKRDAERAAAAAAQKPVAEQDVRGKDKNRRGRISPARIEAASERGKDALPLGDAVKGDATATAPKPETVSPPPDAAKPAAAATPEPSGARPDPVPQVTPAPAAPPSTAETPRARPADTSDDPPSGSTTPAAAAPEPPAAPPPAASAAPPTPPISN